MNWVSVHPQNNLLLTSLSLTTKNTKLPIYLHAHHTMKDNVDLNTKAWLVLFMLSMKKHIPSLLSYRKQTLFAQTTKNDLDVIPSSQINLTVWSMSSSILLHIPSQELRPPCRLSLLPHIHTIRGNGNKEHGDYNAK